MSYEYLTFDGIALPIYNPQTNLSTGAVENPLLDTIGGVSDVVGNAVRLPKQSPISVTGDYIGETSYLIDHLGNYIIDHLGNRIIAASDSNHLRVQTDALVGKLGVRGSLYRSRLDDNVQQWKRARLLSVNYQRTVNDRMVIAHVQAQFATEQAGWRSFASATTTFTVINGEISVTVNMAGTTPVHDASFYVTASSNITSLHVTGSGVDWTWTGTVLASKILGIECGAQTVRNDGDDAYLGFTLNSGHTARSWLPLEPGDNHFVIVANGTSSSAYILYYNQWL